MLKAELNGKEVIASKDLERGLDYHCSNNNLLILKKGQIRIPHFSHHKNNCKCEKYSELETEIHKKMKLELMKILNIDVKYLEYRAIDQVRPDIFWENKNIAFEVQHSSISLDEIYRRNEVYFNHDIIPLWIFDKNKFKNTSQIIKYCQKLYGFILYFSENENKFMKENNNMSIILDTEQLFIDLSNQISVDILKLNEQNWKNEQLNKPKKNVIDLNKSDNCLDNTLNKTRNDNLNPKLYCIHCGCSDYKNNNYYYCNTCLNRINYDKNKQYKEDYCHNCGQKIFVSSYHPYCQNCQKLQKFNGTTDEQQLM